MFDRMTDGEIAAYLEDRDREPPEPDWDEYEDAKHRHLFHDGAECNCPDPAPEPPGETGYDDEEAPF